MENLYGFLAFFGVITFAIIGMLYKILPFLVWYRSYSSRVGAFKVPSLADMYSARLQQAGYWSYLSALVITSAGILLSHPGVVRAGVIILMAAFLPLGLNLFSIGRHMFKPMILPLDNIQREPETKALVFSA